MQSDPTLKDIPVSEAILNFVKSKDLFNYLTDTPDNERLKDPYHEFAFMCRNNLGWAARTLIGEGDFELLPVQTAILEVMWNKRFPILLMTRGGGKTFILAVYSILRAILDQTSTFGHKIVITSASFRQSKNVMKYIETLYERSPLIQEACTNFNGIKKNNDRWEIRLGNSMITALPMGDGEKIRGERATIILCDEFGSVNEEVFNVVVRGFGAVEADPVDKVRANYRRDQLAKRGHDVSKIEGRGGNQVIRSGTATFEFNHFYKTLKQYELIIRNKLKGTGVDQKIINCLGDMGPKFKVDYNDYAIVTLPYEAMPPGYMDETMINDGRATMTEDEFDREYNCKFTTDSVGFFKAKAISEATPGPHDRDFFEIELKREKGGYYVMGIDPARKLDDFALVILRVEPHCHKLVYAARWHQKNFGEIATEIRRLVKEFDIKRIGIDSGGGGTAIMDFLQAPEMIPNGEQPFWEISDTKNKSQGLYILDMINYMGKWLVRANYDMCADIESKRLLFPSMLNENSYDYRDMEAATDMYETINECKRQLIQIEVTATSKSEVEHFDVPAAVKWKVKKDLYSALLIAAYEARVSKIDEAKVPVMDWASIGGPMEEFL